MLDEDNVFGIFQQYRPHGVGVEAIFAGQPMAEAYVVRLKNIYRATAHPAWENDAYFVVRQPLQSSPPEVIAIADSLLQNLRRLSALIAEMGHYNLQTYLAQVNRIEIVPWAQLNLMHDDHATVHEAIGDRLSERKDYDHPIVALREGFYSVACDYWLAWYLMWPYFNDWCPSDIFEPYYQLWARGYRVAFNGQTLDLAQE